MDAFLRKYIENNREAGTDINNGERMKAGLILVLKDNPRTTESMNHCRINKLTWKQTQAYLISEHEYHRMRNAKSHDVDDPSSLRYDQGDPKAMHATTQNQHCSSRKFEIGASGDSCKSSRNNDTHNNYHKTKRYCYICDIYGHISEECIEKQNNYKNGNDFQTGSNKRVRFESINANKIED